MDIHFKSFLIGCLFGISNEYVIKKIKNVKVVEFCMDNKLKCFFNATFFNVYGYGFMFASIIEPYVKKLNIFVQFIIFALLVGLIEFSAYDFIKKFWNKSNPFLHDFKNLYPLFDGKTSILSMIYFSIILLIYVHFVIPKIKSYD